MKTPTDCTSLSEVRSAIDHVDQQIVALLGLRADYVRTAARCKTDESQVADGDRLAAMLEVRRSWAEREKLDPAFIEQLYRDLVDYFISHELHHWRERNQRPFSATL